MTITREQLCELTAAINDAFGEFERDGVPVFRTLMPGQVRLILAKADEWQAKREGRDAEGESYQLGWEHGYLSAKQEFEGGYKNGYEVGYEAAGRGLSRSPDPPKPAFPPDAHGFFAGTPEPDPSTEVHGPTGATIARVGSVQLNGDGTASFALDGEGEGEQVHFRITLDDDESNADRYYRGFNDGVLFVTSGEAEAVKDPAYWGEKPERQNEDEREPDSIDAATGIADDGWCDQSELGFYDTLDDGIEEEVLSISIPPKSAEKLTSAVDAMVAAGLGPAHTLVAPLIPRRTGRPRTLAEADELAAELSAVIVALQGMAIDGAMPAILEYDNARPDGLPRWDTLQKRHSVASWGTMAEMANLRYGYDIRNMPDRERNKPGPKPGADVAERHQPSLAQLVAHLQQTAMAGVMPRQSTWDDTRPVGWARATSQCTRLGVSWLELGTAAGLKRNRDMAEPVDNAA